MHPRLAPFDRQMLPEEGADLHSFVSETNEVRIPTNDHLTPEKEWGEQLPEVLISDESSCMVTMAKIGS